jgi:putative endonuclease
MNPVRATMYYVYVLLNEKGNFYIGFTTDLERCLSEHYKGKSTYTSFRGPYRLIYYEACLSEKDAKARERYLKSGMGRRYLKNRTKHFMEALTG